MTTPLHLINGPDGMIDIETLSTAPNAIILSIGAIKFNPQHLSTPEQLNQHSFYMNVDRVDCAHHGLHTDPDTITWWSQQAPAAQDALLIDPKPLMYAVTKLMEFLYAPPRVNRLWANDPDFDLVILREAAKAVGMYWPFSFWLNRSVRTIKDMGFPNGEVPDMRVGTHHNALDDCLSQAMQVQASFHNIGHVPNTEHPIL